MALRDEVRRLIAELSSNNDRLVASALVSARLILEQSHDLQSLSRAMLDPALSAGLPSDYRALRSRQIRKNFEPFLSAEYMDLALTDEETDAIVDVLLRHLDGPPEAAKSAAWALSDCARPHAVPKLSETLRRYAAVDGMVAGQASRTIARIITSIDPRRVLTSDEQQIAAEARDALAFAALNGVDGIWSAREAAAEALDTISAHFAQPPVIPQTEG